MEKILETSLIHNENSTFLIDLVKHSSAGNYIRITQTVDGAGSVFVLKLNPDLVHDLINVLKAYGKKISLPGRKVSRKDEEIIKRYLKGVPIEDLPVQFNCSIEIIKSSLINNGLEIIDNKMPKMRKYRRAERKY